MSALPAAATQPGPPSGTTIHGPEGELALLGHAGSATHIDTRLPGTNHPSDRLTDRNARALDAARPPVSGDPWTATISASRITRALVSDIRITRDGAPGDQRGSASTTELRAVRSARAPARATLPAASEAALQRLLRRYLAIAHELAPGPPASHGLAPAQASPSDPLTPCQIPDSYLQQTIFFRQFSRPEIAAVRDGLRVLSAPRGTPIDARSALWIVLRGAVQTSVRRGASSRRVRVAGPGRCVGHLSLIAPRSLKRAPILEAELRERAVLLELPIERATTLLDERTRPGRRFAHALNQDITSALHHTAGPLAPASGSSRSFELTAALEATLNTSADMGAQRVLRCWRRA